MTLWSWIRGATFVLSFTLPVLAKAEQVEAGDQQTCTQKATSEHSEALEQASADYHAQMPVCYDREVYTTRAETLLCIKNAELDRREAVSLANHRLELALSECPE